MSTELIRLSDTEDTLLGQALKDGKAPLSVVIPGDVQPRELLAFMKACVSGIGKLSRANEKLGVLLGRGLAIMAERTEILEASGYASLREYEKAEIIDKGLGSHGSVWDHKRVAERFPCLSMNQVKEIGITKLSTAARALPKDASDNQKKEYLSQARESKSTAEFDEWVEAKTGQASGATKAASFELMGPGDQIEELREFLADPGAREWAGTETPIGMVLAAVRESSSEWGGSPASEMTVRVAPVDEPDEEEAEDDILITDSARAEDWQ